jgi:hypothetical protein
MNPSARLVSDVVTFVTVVDAGGFREHLAWLDRDMPIDP